MRGGRRRSGWKSFVPWEETPSFTKGPVCLAPVNKVADIIEMCATVNYINGIESSNDDNPGIVRLKANSVFTAREAGQWRSQTFAAFSTLNGTLPTVLKKRHAYIAKGSEYALTIADKLPEERHNVVDVSLNGLASDTEALYKTVAALAMSINENINPHSQAFKDAVASRFSLFARQRITPSVKREPSANSESSASTNNSLPTPSMHSLSHPRRHKSITAAFKKPVFDSIEELLHFAFATHTIDHITGLGRPLLPDELPTDPSKCQALVFCSPVGSGD